MADAHGIGVKMVVTEIAGIKDLLINGESLNDENGKMRRLWDTVSMTG